VLLVILLVSRAALVSSGERDLQPDTQIAIGTRSDLGTTQRLREVVLKNRNRRKLYEYHD